MICNTLSREEFRAIRERVDRLHARESRRQRVEKDRLDRRDRATRTGVVTEAGTRGGWIERHDLHQIRDDRGIARRKARAVEEPDQGNRARDGSSGLRRSGTHAEAQEGDCRD
jgi:hypothetical protein